MNWKELIIERSGKLSHSKIWANIGSAVMTWGFIYTILHHEPTEWLWIAYGGTLVAHRGFSKWMEHREKTDNSKHEEENV